MKVNPCLATGPLFFFIRSWLSPGTNIKVDSPELTLRYFTSAFQWQMLILPHWQRNFSHHSLAHCEIVQYFHCLSGLTEGNITRQVFLSKEFLFPEAISKLSVNFSFWLGWGCGGGCRLFIYMYLSRKVKYHSRRRMFLWNYLGGVCYCAYMCVTMFTLPLYFL